MTFSSSTPPPPRLSGTISFWLKLQGWIQGCRRGLRAAHLPAARRSLPPRTRQGPDLVPLRGVPTGGGGAASKGTGSSQGCSCSELRPCLMGRRAGCHAVELFFPLAVCHEEPPRRDSRPGPSVPTSELPPRVDAGRTSSARVPPGKQNEISLWRGTMGTGLVFQSLTVTCSSHRLLLEGVISLLNSGAADSFIPLLLGWLHVFRHQGVLCISGGVGEREKKQEERALRCSASCPA